MSKYLLLIVACAPVLFAQTDAGSIRVLVTDSSGLAVAESKVTLVNTATGVQSSRITATDGYVSFTPIPASVYSVEVAKPGFQQTRVNDISVNVDERKLVGVKLAVASVSSTLEVLALAEIVQSEDGSVG